MFSRERQEDIVTYYEVSLYTDFPKKYGEQYTEYLRQGECISFFFGKLFSKIKGEDFFDIV